MRTRILIICTAVIVFCLWLLLHHASEQTKDSQQELEPRLTNQQSVSQLAQPKALEHLQGVTIPNAGKIPPRPTPTDISNLQQRVLADWQRPIEFYGKVVDENTNPVEGASITFGWSETPSEAGEMKTTTQSDADGLFSLHGKHGPSLEVWFSKEDYYASHGGQKGFSYMHGDFSPDPLNPVIFLLQKKGTSENLIGVKQNYRVARDGTPLGIDLVTGKSSLGGSGDLVVQCWTDDQGKPSSAKYDWHCIVTIPGGGLVLSDEEFPFLAPENGYALTNQISMPADRPEWTSDVDLKFFYRLADGRYGRMTFSIIAGGQHFCMIDSVLNPSGSRNLEPP